jgi:fermentation-respiration switch protein FrsA (DUF1100 family)
MSQEVPRPPRRSPGNSLKGLSKSIIRVGVIAYALVIILMVAFESRLVYPGAYMNVPQQQATDVTSVSYESADGIKLTGRLFENPKAEADLHRPTILFFHGNGLTASYESERISRLGKQLQANVMAAEYRGFDSLDGSPHESGIVADALAARDFLCDRYGIQPSELIVYGQSLGGGCAVAVAADSGAKLLVLDRTFDRMVDVAASRYWFIPVRWLMQNRYDSIGRIKDYDGPLVQVHGTTDRLIPIQHGRRLHQAAPTSDKIMIEVDGMGHNDVMPRLSREALLAQIQKYAQKKKE